MPTQREQAVGNDRWDRRWFEIRRAVAGSLEQNMDLGDLYLTHLSFLFKGHEVMAVMKARNGENKKLVGFYSAVDWEAALFGALRQLSDDKVKWREDKPWQK